MYALARSSCWSRGSRRGGHVYDWRVRTRPSWLSPWCCLPSACWADAAWRSKRDRWETRMFEYAAIFTSRERAQLHRVNRSARKTDMIAKKRERFANAPISPLWH
jgi:hypothetical protein